MRSFDLHPCKDYTVVEQILDILKIDYNYEWIIESGSRNGFHIIVKSTIRDDMFIDPVVMTCKPNDKYNGKFEKIEFLWKTHTVLPPSLHMSGKHYEFINCHKPENPPLNVQRFELEKIVAQFSDTNVEYGSTYVKPIFRGKGLSYNAVFPLEINRYWNEEKI